MSTEPEPAPTSLSRGQALVRVAQAYLAGLVVAAVCVVALAGAGVGVLWQTALADLAATVVVFGFSRRHDNSSFYDPYWSVIPIWLIGYLAVLGVAGQANLGRVLLVGALVSLWGLRLTYNWARGWTGLHHEDWRYVDLRRQTGRGYWLVSFFGLHLFPTVVVFLGCLPLFVVTGSAGELGAPRALGGLDLAAAALSLGAIMLEAVADQQLRDYVLHRRRPGETMTEGVWGWSRHPNYLGEIGFWWGLALFAAAAVAQPPWWVWSGAVTVTVMFNVVSIPMIERRMAARRHDYDVVKARVSRLLPWFPRR